MIFFKSQWRPLTLRLVSLAILLLAVSVLGSRPASASSVSCQAFPNIPVALTDTGVPSYHVWGELCATSDELAQPQGTATVQLLLPGGTYGHVYWDLSPNPIDGVSYTYARNEAAAGYPTFVLDRIGTGNSDHPVPSTLIDVNTNATVVHQVVQGLKNGSITGTRFGKVIAMGHSLGSGVAEAEAATYHDVDGVIATGLLHYFNPSGLLLYSTSIHPAGQDPRFAGQPWAIDPGYQTTQPPPNGDVEHGFRAQLFYNIAVANPNVIAIDEQTKETATQTEFDALISTTQQIGVPVLLIIGAMDFVHCDQTLDCSNPTAILHEEGSYYSPQACLQVVSIPLSGHDLSLHPNNSLQVNAALGWSDQFVGRSTSSQPPGCPHS